MTYRQIAEYLKVSTNTVEGQMSIALKKLRSALKPVYFQKIVDLLLFFFFILFWW